MRVLSLLLLLTALAAGSASADFEAFPIKNIGLSRIVSGVENILKTNDVVVAETKLLDQPSVELMLELDYKGERVVLVPGDFNIVTIDRFSRNKVDTIGVELHSRYEGLPLILYVDYVRDPAASYQQKSVTLRPCKEAKGAVLRRVTLESFRFKKNVQPLSADVSGFGSDPKTAFAVVDAKSGKGICFDYPAGKTTVGVNRSLNAVAEMQVSVEDGWKSGQFSIGALTGTPEAAFATYWRFLMETRHPELAKNPKLAALHKRFPNCFEQCTYLPPCSSDGRVTAAGAIANGVGFILLSNTGTQPVKARPTAR